MRRLAILALGLALGMVSWEAGVELWWDAPARQQRQEQVAIPMPEDGVTTAEDGTSAPPPH